MIDNWHELTIETVTTVVDTDVEEGLSQRAIDERQQRDGFNELKGVEKNSWLVTFINQFRNVLIYVLLISAIITFCLGEMVDTLVIIGVVFINAIFGTMQEKKAEKEIDAIKTMLAPTAEVIRGGKNLVVRARELVIGDIVLLKSGSIVPADLRLVETNYLKIREAILTGESNSINKETSLVAKMAPLGDRINMAYSGTEIISGRGKGIVVAVGERTELGKINTMLKNIPETVTPLTQQLTKFSKWLTILIILLASVTFLFGIILWRQNINEIFLAAVGLAVAAIPEGLPPTLTIILALGVQQMAKAKAIVRKLPAVETMGAVTVICTDKTGTLTQNIQTICKIITSEEVIELNEGTLSVNGKSVSLEQNSALRSIVEQGLLCNDLISKYKVDHELNTGNAIDLAILRLAETVKLDLDLLQKKYPQKNIIPYESEHKLMASLHSDHNGQTFIFMKGAPEKILSTCSLELKNGQPQGIQSEYWFNQIDHLAKQGYRLLAIAYKPTERDTLSFDALENGFVLVGLLALIDPPRTEVIEAIKACHQANIEVKMITGDYAVTAVTIAEQVGINCEAGVLTGTEIDQLTDDQLAQKVAEINVFARTSPRHKLKLVEILQQQKEIVAMTGDGANDAPALSKANIGVAMGQKGADIAKEASEIVLADDNFATIVGAIKAGRVVFDNVKKMILHILPTNAAEALVIVFAVLFGTTLPITAVQILWVNMVTSITLSLTLGFEKSETNLMARSPRDTNGPIFENCIILYMIFVALLLVCFVFGIFYYEMQVTANVTVARTAAVNMLIFGEAAFLLNCRKLYGEFMQQKEIFKENPAMIGALLVLLFIQISFTYVPFMQTTFSTAHLAIKNWLYILSGCCIIFILAELVKVGWVLPQLKREYYTKPKEMI